MFLVSRVAVEKSQAFVGPLLLLYFLFYLFFFVFSFFLSFCFNLRESSSTSYYNTFINILSSGDFSNFMIFSECFYYPVCFTNTITCMITVRILFIFFSFCTIFILPKMIFPLFILFVCLFLSCLILPPNL